MENYLFMEKGTELCETLCNWYFVAVLMIGSECLFVSMKAFYVTHEHIDLCY